MSSLSLTRHLHTTTARVRHLMTGSHQIFRTSSKNTHIHSNVYYQSIPVLPLPLMRYTSIHQIHTTSMYHTNTSHTAAAATTTTTATTTTADPEPNAVTSTTDSDGITTITINREHRRNAIDGLTGQKLTTAFLEFEANEKAKICVFYGAHGTFCAGFDLHEVALYRGEGKYIYTLRITF